MNISDIIDEFSTYKKGYLPKEAMLAAREQWHELRPELVKRLEKYLNTDLKVTDEDSIFLLFGIMLIADVKDTSLAPLLTEFLNQDDDAGSNLDAILGDALTESLADILAAVAAEDYRLILPLTNPTPPGEWVKSSAIKSIFMLYRRDILSRQELTDVIDNWLKAFSEAANASEHLGPFLMSTLVEECIKNKMDEYKEQFKAFQQQGLVDNSFFDSYQIEQWKARSYPGTPEEFDAIKELGGWHSFTPEKEYRKQRAQFNALLDNMAMNNPAPLATEEYKAPYVAPKKIGRNDPCPCGSGKKYKKCCMS